MNFNFRLADVDDLSDIMELMNQTRDTVCPKEWFVEDTEDSVRHILSGNGFIILAIPQDSEEMAGFFIIKFPGLSEENLGNWIAFSDDKLLLSAHMESTAVYPAFRGYHLQAQMAAEAEKLLIKMPYHYLFATIHPDNHYSMKNMLSRDYHVIKKAKMYGGLDRAILLKKI